MSPQPSSHDPVALLGLGACLAVLVAMALYLRQRSELEDELRIARGRREELEQANHTLRGQVDGALETIQKLSEERGEPGDA